MSGCLGLPRNEFKEQEMMEFLSAIIISSFYPHNGSAKEFFNLTACSFVLKVLTSKFHDSKEWIDQDLL